MVCMEPIRDLPIMPRSKAKWVSRFSDRAAVTVNSIAVRTAYVCC